MTTSYPLATLMDLSPVAMVVIDAHNQVTMTNNAATNLISAGHGIVLGADISQVINALLPRQAGNYPDGITSYTLHMNRQDGSPIQFEVRQQQLADEGLSLLTFAVECCELTGNHNAVQISDNFQNAFQQAPIGMMLVDLEWQLQRVNQSICEMLGYTEQELLGKTFQQLTHPDDLGADLDLVRKMIAGDINDYRMEKRYFHKDGQVIWMLLSVSLLKDVNRIPQYFIFHIVNISDYKRIQKQISEYAYYDALTNLPNRRLLQDRLSQALTQAKRYRRQLGILFLDIDFFKTINDTYGHAFGDELIRQVATRLTECVRSADTVCRLGGDEFVIIVSELSKPQVIALIANKIINSMSQPVVIDGITAEVSLSIGGVIYDADHADDANSLMKKADLALYEMKANGRNGFRLFNGETEQA